MDKNMTTPPSQLGRARGVPAVKPKDMKGTLIRLWQLTKGHRKGLGWILLFSALASGAGGFDGVIHGRLADTLFAAVSDGGYGTEDDSAYPYQSVCPYGETSPVLF